MDETVIRAMFDQNLSSVKTFVQMMYDNLHREIKEVRAENIELKKSLEFSQSEIDTLKKLMPDVRSSENTVKTIGIKTDDLSNRFRLMEDLKRKKNLRITGLPENPGENSEQTQVKVGRLIAEKLQLGNVKIKNAFRAGNTNILPRPIIAKLVSVDDRNSCSRSFSKLKGSNIYLSEDVSKATLDIRKDKLPLLKEKREQGLVAYFSGTEIVTKQRFTRNQASTTSLPGGSSSGPSHINNNDVIPPESLPRPTRTPSVITNRNPPAHTSVSGGPSTRSRKTNC